MVTMPPPGWTPPIAKKTGEPCKACTMMGRPCVSHDPNHKNKGGVPPAYTEEQIAAALLETRGMVATAAKNLGIGQTTMYKAIRRWPRLRSIIESARERFVDKAETGLQDAVDGGEAWAIKFTLSTVGKHRGYVERTEHTGPGGGPIEVEQSIPLDRLSPKLKRAIIAELEAMGELIESEDQPLLIEGEVVNEEDAA